ncbi:hypothetical protein [Gilvimarinus algae]|uniref:WD40 repeat protein n=1 Tax=Gilvimarinus algae TaxID=3058037 RepID=A0ABT8TAE4_9GAMM|nr:hypothetical protein [Gilvimarinus sp. SDUM040014]MDO3380605.1 hypothetical protein [Gilvimarinus sp. SDUM040014]
MKKQSVVTTLLLSAMAMANSSYSQQSTLPLTGPYLGQKSPGAVPQVFAPGTVSSAGWETGGVFSPDLKEFYFIRKNQESNQQEIVVIENEGSRWNESVFSPRTGTPLFSPDGNTMHLGTRYRTRTADGWSEMAELDPPLNNYPIMRLTASSEKTYFFDEFKQDLTGDIRYSKIVDGKHQAPQLLGSHINSGKSFHPFVAPDESYLIFDSKRSGGYGDSDLYISYKLKNGSWSNPINLGEKINTEGWEAVASVTSDGKYMIFNRNPTPGNHENVDIFWVNADFIQSLRPKP